MRASAVVAVAAVIVTGMLLLTSPVDSGCHGGCPVPATPEALPEVGLYGQLIGTSLLSGAATSRLNFIRVDLGNGERADSIISRGEATTFFVQSGNINFTVESGEVRVVPGSQGGGTPAVTPTAASGEPFSLSSGDAVFQDVQDDDVIVRYENMGSDEAVILIASVLPAATPDASPASS